MAKFVIFRKGFFFLYASIALLTTLEFIKKNFGSVQIEQILFFLADEEGVIGTEPSLYASAFLLIVIKPLILIFIGYGLLRLIVAAFDLIFVNEHDATVSSYIYRAKIFGKLLLRHSWIFFFSSAVFFMWQIGAANAITRSYGEDLFAKLYYLPQEFSPQTKDHKKNLIILYVESLETSLRSDKVFGENLLAPIDRNFKKEPLNLYQSPGTSWTIAGMVSSQCGVPLQGYMGNRLSHKNGKILASARCLSDYLSDMGYQQYFYVGPDLKFSGMDKFYSAHGYENLIGLEQIKQLGIEQRLFTGWGGGVHDDTLLEIAYKQINSLHRAGTAFSVSIITTDNHAPDGKPSERCTESELASGFRGTFRCTSRQVGFFLEKLRDAGILENTVVILMGDHLFMNNPSQNNFFSQVQHRFVYFNFIDPAIPSSLHQRDRLTHFDVAPTILEMMTGYTGKYTRLGLGRSLFEPDSEDYQNHLNAVTSENILNYSALYRSLWGNAPITTNVSDRVRAAQ
jgi:phosphoglycerol transferase